MHDGKKRVLVIDDDPDVRVLVQSLLEAEGFDVRTAADGREGLDLQEGEPADVVVTDIFMPNKDGVETIHELHRKFPHTGIVVVSGGGSATSNIDYLHIARLLGASHTLQKPVRPDFLVDVVRGLACSPPANGD
jgi:two-component system chemotaxis response regulator CheY